MLSNPRPRVLCVDDDQDSRVMLITLLKLALIEAKAVGTAAHALSLIQTERFDLYLLDAGLPDLDGFELCRRMRAFDPHDGLLASIRHFVSHAENATATIIPFGPKTFSPPYSFKLAAA
jgi:DNA-binding response OmpR family regulator